jgi:hypothetical protein
MHFSSNEPIVQADSASCGSYLKLLLIRPDFPSIIVCIVNSDQPQERDSKQTLTLNRRVNEYDGHNRLKHFDGYSQNSWVETATPRLPTLLPKFPLQLTCTA